jgi:hypothetical protein
VWVGFLDLGGLKLCDFWKRRVLSLARNAFRDSELMPGEFGSFGVLISAGKEFQSFGTDWL